MNVNSILLRRKNKMLIPLDSEQNARTRVNSALIATFNLNIQALGYSLSPAVIAALGTISATGATKMLEEAFNDLKELKGVRAYRPMYPNFPKQVMEASAAELYLNAIVHYLSFVIVDMTGNPDNIWLPKYDKEKRNPLDEKFKATVIDLATNKEVEKLATAIATSNTSLSASDKEDLRGLYKYGYLDFPETVPNKETNAVIGALFFSSKINLASHFKTTTDVLRLATALSDGDVSLAKDSKFRQFSRPERRQLLGLMDVCDVLDEDMVRWKERWLRLIGRLHPGNYHQRFKRAFTACSNLRNTKIHTIRTHIEAAVRSGDTIKALTLLSQRPGDFARRLDHLLRQAKSDPARIVDGFLAVAPEVSTPVLLQVMTHFKHRANIDSRIIFPKGNVARVMTLEKPLGALHTKVVDRIVQGIVEVLENRFANLPKLGKVYIDPKLEECLVPFSQRSASKALRTLVRGSKLGFGDDKNTLRFFIWWKDMATETKNDDYWSGSRVDLDLSATVLNEDWKIVESLTYYNLRERYGWHSGDITSAPNGASEFIDIDIEKALKRGRYIVMTVNSYTGQNFSELPECFAGWMLREKPQSGEIYDPRTVTDKVDLSMEAKAGIPMIIDLVDRKVIWADAAMTINPYGQNNVHNNKGTIELLGKALTRVLKPNLYNLLSLHARARGIIVTSPEEADVVFSVDSGTPFELERIASEFMADVKVEKAIAAK